MDNKVLNEKNGISYSKSDEKVCVGFYEFNEKNKKYLLKMMKEFYKSDAVSHPIPTDIIEKLLEDILSKEFGIKGYEIYIDSNLIGFGILTTYYTSEIAGITVQFEDIYIQKEYRSNGVARKYIDYIMKENPSAKRFRLEVSPTNKRAIKLYTELGFEMIEYHQMIVEK